MVGVFVFFRVLASLLWGCGIVFVVIPFFTSPSLPFGLHGLGVLLSVGVIVFHVMFVRRARVFLRAEEAEGLGIGVGLCAFLGAYGVGRLVASGGTLSSAGGLLFGVAALVLGSRWRRWPLLRVLDSAAYAFPFGWFFARGGCALAHDHLGPVSGSFLAIRFPTLPRLDLGFLEWLATPFLMVLVVFLAQRARRPGLVSGVLALGYGALRLGLDFLRLEDPRFLHFTAAQWVCVLMLLPVGLLLILRGKAQKSPSGSSQIE